MKVHFDGVNLGSTSGPNSFATRLVRELLNQGHELVDQGPSADVSLVFIEPTGQPLAKRVVQRLDGIWFKPSEFETKNSFIKSLYQQADAVIWQSEFDRTMTTKWWGDPRSGAVIHNGIESQKIDVPGRGLDQLRSKCKHIFVCSANWHPQKRLRSNLELFAQLRQNGYSDSCLIVMGSNPDVWVPSPHVMYTGPVTHADCLAIYSVADWMIHLAWLDHCPNVVVEALSQDVPVICSSAGGTKELVGGYGLVLNETNEYTFELADYDNPPMIDVKQVTSLPDRTLLGPHIDINISNVASKYIELFQSIQ